MLDGHRDLLVALGVAVQHEQRRIDAGRQRGDDLAAAGDVEAEPLLDHHALDRGARERLRGEHHARARPARRELVARTRAPARAAPARPPPAPACRTRRPARPRGSRRRAASRRRRRRCRAGRATAERPRLRTYNRAAAPCDRPRSNRASPLRRGDGCAAERDHGACANSRSRHAASARPAHAPTRSARPPPSCAATSGVGDRWRFASIELREPSKADRPRLRPGRRDPPRGGRDLLEPRRRRRLQGARRRSATTASPPGSTQPDGQPNMTVDEFHECDEALRRDPRVIEALAAARDHRHGPRPDRHLGLRRPPRARAPPRRPDRLGGRLVPQAGGREPVREPGHRPALRRRPQPHGAARGRGHHRVDEPETMGEYVPHLVPGLRLRDDLKPLEIIQPEGASFTLDGNVLRWQKWSLRVGFNHREGLVLHTVGYDDGGALARRAPAVVRRDGRALPRPDARPLPPHRVRHRRVGPWLHDDVARARLRLPRRDPLPRRGAARHARRAVHDPQRDLHPRGGQRGPVEARRRAGRRRGAPRAPARGLLPRHRRQLRVPRLLALLPGRQHRVRGARDRDHGHDALRRGRAAAVRHARRRAHLRAVPPALPRRPARPRRRRRGQHGLRDASPRRCRSARTTRTGSRSCSATRRCAPSRRASRTTTGAPSAPGRSSTTTSPTGSGRRSATSSSPAPRSRR